MWDHDQVEAGGTGGERTHLRQKEGGRSLLRTPGGGGGRRAERQSAGR